MTVEEEASDEKSEGKRIVVGIQMDANGSELLDWALTNIADKGDLIVAVHVCRKLGSSSTLTLIEALEDYLTDYKGLCNLKQVSLVGRVSTGCSIRTVLVKVAKVLDAITLVVGVKKSYTFGVSASLAKFCAKNLPPTTALIAVHNGKVVFERPSSKPTSGQKTTIRNVLHPSATMDSKVITPSSKTKSYSRIARLSDVGFGDGMKEEKREEGAANSVTALVRKLPEPRVGWPLLRKAVSANIEALRDDKARKMSVVQWVMHLPNRSVPSIQIPQLDFTKELKTILQKNSSNCRWFRYEELQSSTNRFASENLIGKGGNSQVYKGCLPSGQQVAIKISKLSAEASRDFLLEVNIITRLRHERIVPLVGICVEDNNLIYVYSFLHKGSLEENLHGKKAKPLLSWDKRFKVAVGVAEALSYLHNGSALPVIHRDVKSSNILLTDDFEPQLSDFGLAMWAPVTSKYDTHNDIVGTFGYLAPEYFMYGKVSDKIDVYAFGVVLLELLTGRKPISNDQESLVMWATPILERGDLMDLLDPDLDAQNNEAQMRRMVLAAALCITRAARLRPEISQMLRLLRGEEEIEAWMNCRADTAPNELECQDDEAYPASSARSHLGLALLDVEDDASVTSFEQSHFGSLEEYLRGRWSRSSSFD